MLTERVAYDVENDSHSVAEFHCVQFASAAVENVRRTPGRRASPGSDRDRDAENTQRGWPQAARRRDPQSLRPAPRLGAQIRRGEPTYIRLAGRRRLRGVDRLRRRLPP